jgi:hypothetical protein
MVAAGPEVLDFLATGSAETPRRSRNAGERQPLVGAKAAMTEQPPTLDAWRRLYDAAASVWKLAPWQWLQEKDVFAIEAPGPGGLVFVSVMGALGQHYAIAVYLGTAAFYDFLDLERSDTGPPERVLEILQIQASFETRRLLERPDLETMKALGIAPAARGRWPRFRSYRPGFAPWFLDAPEADLLALALEQTLDVAPRCRQDPSLLAPRPEGGYLVRAPGGHPPRWEDGVRTVARPAPAPIPSVIDPRVIADLKRGPRSSGVIEVDVVMCPATVGPRGARPFIPYLLLPVEARSGMILGVETLDPTESFEAMWGRVPEAFGRQLLRSVGIPAEVRTRSGRLVQLLQPLAAAVGFKLRRMRDLPGVEAAKASLTQFLSR